MPKRKAHPDSTPDDPSPHKRRTRSDKPLTETQPLLSRKSRAPKTPSKKPAPVESSTPRTRAGPSVQIAPSLKENYVDGSDDADELNLPSPSKSRSHRATSRVVMEAVELSAPSRDPSRTPGRDTGSLTPPRAGRNDHAEEISRPPFLTPSLTRTAIAARDGCSIPQVNPTSPTKSTADTAPLRLPTILLPHLYPCLSAQKRSILAALQQPPEFSGDEDDEDGPLTNTTTSQQLSALLAGTVTRDEGNSCLILGPRGSGKTRVVESAIRALADRPIIIRLSGWAQHNDRLAMREVARQLSEQTGQSFLSDEDADDIDANAENPFADSSNHAISLPPPSHLPALISVLPTLLRPTIVVLDGFDLFALHPRQSLLYCLLDTVQSCRAGNGSRGVAVIGVTTRTDTVNLLEKRVKSRFSGRMLRTAAPRIADQWIDVAEKILSSHVDVDQQEWQPMWDASVSRFLRDAKVVAVLRETFGMFRDARMLSQILMNVILQLTPKSPFPQLAHLSSSVLAQRSRPRFHFLSDLPYPSICLLVAAIHAHTAGHDIITFEMLHETFRDQLRSSTSAPVEVEGGGIGMVRCTREVLKSAFEMLIASKVFVPTAATSATVVQEFVKYRCVVERGDVKKATDNMGQTNLKKWLSKAQ